MVHWLCHFNHLLVLLAHTWPLTTAQVTRGNSLRLLFLFQMLAAEAQDILFSTDKAVGYILLHTHSH